jgi:dTDP-4-dehydrorhamnose reductase
LKIALIGSDGQLGTDIYSYFKSKGADITGLTIDDINVCNGPLCGSVLTGLNPDLVINTAAFNQVDRCESEPQKAFEVNAAGVKNVAEACQQIDAAMMHFSTDYVFGGYMRDTPYTEDDCPAPISSYGISKLAGEYMVSYLLSKYYIIRVSGLYGHAGSMDKGYNFVELMLELAEKQKEIKVVNDQTLTPTSSKDAAQKLYELIQTGKYGLYHMTNTGSCTWHEFAGQIFKITGINTKLMPTDSKSFASAAKRPSYSVLDNKKLRQSGLEDMRNWKQALAQYLEERSILWKS